MKEAVLIDAPALMYWILLLLVLKNIYQDSIIFKYISSIE